MNKRIEGTSELMQQMTELPCPHRKDIKCCQENKFKKGKDMSRLKRTKNWKKRIINNTGKKLVNGIGCVIAKWILHNCDDGLVITRKGGAKQIIKVFAEPAYKNIIKPAIFKSTEQIKVGDVVTDDGYCGEVVVTSINGEYFRGYYRADGVPVAGLKLKNFEKIVNHVDLKIGPIRRRI